MASCPGPDAPKHAQTTILPPPRFTDGIRFLCWNAVFSFLQTETSHFNQKARFLTHIHPINVFRQSFGPLFEQQCFLFKILTCVK